MFALIDATEMGTATDNIRVFQKNSHSYVTTVKRMWLVRRKPCISERIFVSYICLFWIQSP